MTYFWKIPRRSMEGEKKIMLEFVQNTYMLEYQDGAYICNGTKRVEAPLNLETLEEAVKQCPKLQQVSLDDAPFGDGCFPILAQIPKLNMLALLRGRQIAGHGLKLLKDLPLKDLFLQRTGLDDEGLAQAAPIKKLENINIAACQHVTPKGLLAISWRDKLRVSDTDMHGEQVTKSKFWLYAEQGIFYYRYLMRLVDGKWMVDNAQWCQKGRWSFCGL